MRSIVRRKRSLAVALETHGGQSRAQCRAAAAAHLQVAASRSAALHKLDVQRSVLGGRAIGAIATAANGGQPEWTVREIDVAECSVGGSGQDPVGWWKSLRPAFELGVKFHGWGTCASLSAGDVNTAALRCGGCLFDWAGVAGGVHPCRELALHVMTLRASDSGINAGVGLSGGGDERGSMAAPDLQYCTRAHWGFSNVLAPRPASAKHCTNNANVRIELRFSLSSQTEIHSLSMRTFVCIWHVPGVQLESRIIVKSRISENFCGKAFQIFGPSHFRQQVLLCTGFSLDEGRCRKKPLRDTGNNPAERTVVYLQSLNHQISMSAIGAVTNYVHSSTRPGFQNPEFFRYWPSRDQPVMLPGFRRSC